MDIYIWAEKHQKRRGYIGAQVKLPASRYAREDALIRARVSEGEACDLEVVKTEPPNLGEMLNNCMEKTLEELNFLAYKIDQMNEFQKGAYEGILGLIQQKSDTHHFDMKELINAAYEVENYDFIPGIRTDEELGAAAIEGEMLDILANLPEEVYRLLSEEKAGEALRLLDKGIFTEHGYVFRISDRQTQQYDGNYLPELIEEENMGILSICLTVSDETQGNQNGVWLNLPADEAEISQVLEMLEEENFDDCLIIETRCAVPALEYQFAGDEEIGKINRLAKLLDGLAKEGTLSKYKAIIELEQCNSLGMALDLANNLNCYEYDPNICTLEDYGEYVLKIAGIDPGDAAFDYFDFRGFGERQLQKQEYHYVPTAFGLVVRNEKPWIQEITLPDETGIVMQ